MACWGPGIFHKCLRFAARSALGPLCQLGRARGLCEPVVNCCYLETSQEGNITPQKSTNTTHRVILRYGMFLCAGLPAHHWFGHLACQSLSFLIC